MQRLCHKEKKANFSKKNDDVIRKMLTSAILCNQKNLIIFLKRGQAEDYSCKVSNRPPLPTYTCSKKPNRCRVKELGILLKCRETFEQFFAACNSSKNTRYAEFYEFKTTSLTSKTTFFKKVNPLKYPVQTYILVLLFTYLLVYPIKSIICIPSHEIFTKYNKKHLTWLKLYLVIISTLELKVNKQKNHLSFSSENF